MTSLITDRTESDVLLGTEKGHYSYADLNRVEQAVSDLIPIAQKVGLTKELTVKTDWGFPGRFSVYSWPTETQMERYLSNVFAIAEIVEATAGLPKSMAHLDWQKANSIERALEIVYERIQGIIATWKYCGEAIAGEETL